MTGRLTTPAGSASFPETAIVEAPAPRIAVRRSVVLCAALGIFVLTATLAVLICLAPRLGPWQAAPLALAVGALMALCSLHYDRTQPVALKIGSDGLSAWDRTGRLIAQGRIAGCSQWSGRLLILALAPAHGRKRTLLLTADALPAPAFRELAVIGRRGAGA